MRDNGFLGRIIGDLAGTRFAKRGNVRGKK